jgi:hypothetical protein
MEVFKVLREATSGIRRRAAEEIFDAIAEQEFVTENLFIGGENGLAGDKIGSGLG